MRPARVTLRVDGAVVGTATGPISDVFTSATVLVGQGTADAGASTCYWDDVHLWLGSSDPSLIPRHTREVQLMAARQAILLAVLATEIQIAVEVWRHALAVLGH